MSNSVTTVLLKENNTFVYDLGAGEPKRVSPKEFFIYGDSSASVLDQLNNAILRMLEDLNMTGKLGNVLVSYRYGEKIEDSVIEQDGKFCGKYSISVIKHSIDFLDAFDNSIEHHEL